MNVGDLAGRTLALAGMFALIGTTNTVARRYPKASWQRRTLHLASLVLTAALLSVATLH